MIREFEFYHGVVLRDLVVCRRPHSVSLRLADNRGRLNSFIVDDRMGLHIKHSSARISPWQFVFGEDTLLELGSLAEESHAVWLALICGEDGVVFLPQGDLFAMNVNSGGAYIRVDRDKRTMYRVSGSSGRLQRAVKRGAQPLLNALLEDE